MTLKKRMIGATGLEVTELGLGTAAMAGNHRPVAIEDHRGALQEGLGRGINFLDTAPFYGFGRSCLLYTSPSPRDRTRSRMPSSA